jgi:hypothetical protein
MVLAQGDFIARAFAQPVGILLLKDFVVFVMCGA